MQWHELTKAAGTVQDCGILLAKKEVPEGLAAIPLLCFSFLAELP